MSEPFKAVYKELKIRQDITETLAKADVVLDSKSGTVEISGLPPGLNMDDITVSCEKAYTDVESVVGPAQLNAILSRNPEVVVTTADGQTIEGKFAEDREAYMRKTGSSLIKEDGTVIMLPNERAIANIELKEKLRREHLLRVAYSRDNADKVDAQISIRHLLSGLSFGGVVYELDFGDEKLGLSPFVYLRNKTPFDFEDVKLTLVMPENPSPEGDRIRPEISPLEQYVRRSEDIAVKRRQYHRDALREPKIFAAALRSHDTGDGGEAMLCEMAEIEPEETIEGTVAAVDTEGKYSLSQGENKKVRLKGIAVDSYHRRAKVLLLNPKKYEHSGTQQTTIIDAVRFTPNSDLKAGSFYFDGQQLLFPAMRKGQEYELGLRTCRNLEAQVSKESSSKPDERGEKTIITTTYNVKLVNNTGNKQTVEVNIPAEVMSKMGAKFESDLEKYEEKKIAGEQYYVANLEVKPHSTKEFKFSLETK